MKKFLFVFLMVLVAASLFAVDVPLFVFVDLDGDRLAESTIREQIFTLLDQRGGFYPENLQKSEVELLINGMRINYQNTHIGYAIAVTIVFHDPQLVRLTNTKVMTARTDLDGIRWAAGVSVDYLYSFFD